MKHWVVIPALAALLMAQPAAAQQQAPSQDDEAVTELPSIDVRARAQRDVIESFVQAVTASPGHQGQVAQFNGAVCPGVVNLPAIPAQAINDRPPCSFSEFEGGRTGLQGQCSDYRR